MSGVCGKVLTDHERSDVRYVSEVIIGHGEPDIRHEKRSPNRPRRIVC